MGNFWNFRNQDGLHENNFNSEGCNFTKEHVKICKNWDRMGKNFKIAHSHHPIISLCWRNSHLGDLHKPIEQKKKSFCVKIRGRHNNPKAKSK